jgi:ureidoglycolate hydrolase
LLVLEQEADFVVIDRGADDENCDIVHFDEAEHEAVLAPT